jgi:cephalosporin-C deacetylase-like acetyl esterase
MALFDLSFEQLREYQPGRVEQPDFDAFWNDTLAQARRQPLNAAFERLDAGLRTIESYDGAFSGYDGQRAQGWLNIPSSRSGRLPVVVECIGHGEISRFCLVHRDKVETVFAAYNPHEGGSAYQQVEKARYLQPVWPTA